MKKVWYSMLGSIFILRFFEFKKKHVFWELEATFHDFQLDSWILRVAMHLEDSKTQLKEQIRHADQTRSCSFQMWGNSEHLVLFEIQADNHSMELFLHLSAWCQCKTAQDSKYFYNGVVLLLAVSIGGTTCGSVDF